MTSRQKVKAKGKAKVSFFVNNTATFQKCGIVLYKLIFFQFIKKERCELFENNFVCLKVKRQVQ